MFTITSTRIVGLIAVVCAFVVAPQALAATSTQSRIFLPDDPSDVTPDAVPGNDLSGIDPSILNGIRAYQQHVEYLRGRAQAAAQGYDLSGLDLSVLNGIRGYEKQDQYLKGLALAALARSTQKSVKAGSTAAAKKSAVLPEPTHPPTNPGRGAAATAAKKSAAVPAPALAVKTAPGWVCNGQGEDDSVYLGCE